MEFELYFSDLTPEAQKRLIAFWGISDPSELNLEVVPICILERGEGDETDDETIGVLI